MGGEAAAREGKREGEFLAGKYLLERCLGIGGMGEVYRATNVSLGRQVAIKLLSRELTHNEDDVLRFLREARAAAAVRHPNVVDVFDVGRDEDGTPFIVQELLAGEDLEQYLQVRGGQIGEEEALEILIPVADAVAAAHAHDVVHRDLKPANIFLAREGNRITPKVLDFGACLYQTIGGVSSRERRMLIGTPHYMAPEQIAYAASIDVRADVWALGVILFELLVGETPFEAETADAVMKLVRTRAVPPLRSLAKTASEDVELLVLRCLQRERSKRFAGAAEVREQLAKVRDRLRSSARGRALEVPDVPTPSVSGYRDRSPVAAGGVKRVRTSRRGAALLTLSEADEDFTPSSRRGAEPPASTQRPIEAARPIPAAPDLDAPIGPKAASKPAAKKAPAPVLTTPASELEPFGTPRDVELEESPAPPLDLDLAPPGSRRGEALASFGEASGGPISSIPPVLDPRSAARAAESPAPPAAAPTSSPSPRTATPISARPPAPSASSEGSIRLGPPAAPRPASVPRVAPTWTREASARFALSVAGPALAGYVLLRVVPSLTAPLGHAMRGDSPLASGVLAMVALVGAIALAATTLSGRRSKALVLATAGAVLLGVVMIIVTFSASEAAALGIPATAASLVPFVAPVAPVGLALAAGIRARDVWLDRYERRDALTFALVASLMLLAALELGPGGAVRTRASQPAAASAARATP